MTAANNLMKAEAPIETMKGLRTAEWTRKHRICEAIALAALGSIPWVGGFLAAAAAFTFDEAGVKQDTLRNLWLEEHHHKLNLLRATLSDVFLRIQGLGEESDDRLESPAYLGLIRKAFRAWDQADTEDNEG
jgi:hypothetical protein